MLSWCLVRVGYFVATVFAYEVVSYFAPLWLTCCHRVLVKCISGAVVSSFIFEMTKEKIFKKQVKPRNKAVFISGCDSGFGKLAAIQLDTKGYHVFAGCLFPTGDGATELKNICSERLRLVHVDVTSDEIVEKAKDFVEQNLGTCDLWAVVNNAGVLKGFNIDFTPLSDFREVFEVNDLGQVRVTKALLPLLKTSKGRVVNINSLAGRIPVSHMAAYVMSKHASVAFTECLKQEMHDWGIQVISVEPEFFKTPMTDSSGVRHYLQDMLNNLDRDTRAAYGPQYMTRVLDMVESSLSSLSGIEPVTRAIEEAVVSRRPCPVYRPCGNTGRRAFFCLSQYSSIFVDMFLKCYFAYWGVPVPRGAKTK